MASTTMSPHDRRRVAVASHTSIESVTRYVATNKRLQHSTQAAIEAALRECGLASFLRTAVASAAALPTSTVTPAAHHQKDRA
jgi:hypothetical protein